MRGGGGATPTSAWCTFFDGNPTPIYVQGIAYDLVKGMVERYLDPADAKDRMSEAAGLLIGLTKVGVRSDNKADWAAFGVIDPTEPGLDLEGRGKRALALLEQQEHSVKEMKRERKKGKE